MSNVAWILISWPTLILFGVGLRMALRLTYGARGPDPSDPVHGYLTIVSWALIIIGIAPIVAGGLYTVFGAIILLMGAVTVIEVVTQRRASQRRSLCTLLSLLVERREKLDSSAVVSSHAMRGSVGRAAKQMVDSLDTGTPLDTAVRQHPRALPREAVAYLAAGKSGNAESAALRELSKTDHSELSTIWRACVDRTTYLVCVLAFMVAVLTFVMIKIVPAFRDIFVEFNLDLPPVTELAVVASNFFVHYLALPVALLIPFGVVASGIVGLCYLLDIPVLRPLVDQLFPGRRIADVLRILAVATEQREPLADVLKRLARDYPSGTIRGRLAPAAKAVSSGANWQTTLVAADVVNSPEGSLLKAAERAANLPWAFRQIARRREKRAIYRLSAAVQVLYPLVILLLGSVVAFFVISLFIPLVKLVEGLAR